MSAAAVIAVDIGGTFTDIVAARGDGRLHVAKVSSTTHDPERAVVEGLAALIARSGIAPDQVVEVVQTLLGHKLEVLEILHL